MDLWTSSPFFVVITLLSTYLVAFAYKNTKFVLKHKVGPCFVLEVKPITMIFLYREVLVGFENEFLKTC